MLNLPTPCHILDLDALNANLDRISKLKHLSGCSVYLAIKGFSAPYLFGTMSRIIDGISASGLYEARLGREEFGKYVQTYSPAFRDDQINDVLKYSDAIVFNSVHQLEKYGQLAKKHNRTCGIRINPLVSSLKGADNDPCQQYSHLGVPITSVTPELFERLDGIHVHAMCEQNSDALEKLVELLDSKFSNELHNLKWINLGGGQLIGNKCYDIERAAICLKYLKNQYNIQVMIEPCEGILSECGYFATTVLDIFENDGMIAVLDSSPVCHMQDAVFRNWSRDIICEAEFGYTYRLCGQTCFAGDSFGWYTFEEPLQIGKTLFLKDTATYTWVKNNAFNGIPFPAICTYSSKEGFKIIKEYDYNNFYSIL